MIDPDRKEAALPAQTFDQDGTTSGTDSGRDPCPSGFVRSRYSTQSAWSVGERELFAAYTSHLNACHF